MSWHYSRALVEAYSAATSSGSEPSAPSNGSPTPQAYCSPDRMTACSRLSRFGMTFAPLTDDRGEALLTWYRGAFPARTSAQQEKARESMANAAGCGGKWQESSVKYSRPESSWKTHRCLWDEVLPWSSVILPKWGMTRDGLVYRHRTAERPISATGSGLWQTPVADDAASRKDGKFNSRGEPKLSAQVKLFPTPTTQDNCQSSGQYTGKTGTTLGYAARYWPTPNCKGYRSDGELVMLSKMVETEQEFIGMSHTAAKSKRQRHWPTPTASQHKGWSKNHNRADTDDRLDYTVEREAHQNQTTGQLNPTWVEWLMGWPLGWTDLKPLAMDRFREWWQQHGEF